MLVTASKHNGQYVGSLVERHLGRRERKDAPWSSLTSSPLTSAFDWAFFKRPRRNLADLTGQRPWTTPKALAWEVRPLRDARGE